MKRFSRPGRLRLAASNPWTLFACLCMAALPRLAGCGDKPSAPLVDESVHAFYYGWYANVETDGEQRHWNHDVLGVENGGGYPGGDDIGANYYPELNDYSSNDPRVVRRHLQQCVEAGVGVLVASWWGAGSFEDDNLPLLLDTAADFGVEIAIHLEPIPGRDAATSREAVVYLLDRYGDHPAFHRSEQHGGRPFFYVYDSYLTPAEDWARLLQPDGDLTVRGTDYDIVAIGLWVQRDEESYFLEGGFDGYYTYFASDGFTYGSTSSNWPELAAKAVEHDLIFVPCAGPGYIDTRIRPWNASTTRSRESGAYYDRLFERAIAVRPPVIGVTSFNEWHEGTQIEPAVAKTVGDYVYEDYAPLEPDDYLVRTKTWVDAFRRQR